MSDKPTLPLDQRDIGGWRKPTGEWTMETIALLQAHGGIDAILAAHKAALAAEQENYALALQMSRIEGKRANEAETQLADEHEKVQEARRLLDDWVVTGEGTKIFDAQAALAKVETK